MTTAFGAVPASLGQGDGSAGIGPLPFAMTPLIGREAQVAAVTERLASPTIRLLSLIGPGGIGKTRLALEAAHAVRHAYRDGVHLLRFASVTDPALVPVAIARALDVRGPADDPAWMMAYDRHSMLVIDNFEQLLAAAPSIVEVLSRCPYVTILVTSRVPLHVTGEHQYQVPRLMTPTDDAAIDPATLAQADAVRLFVERAITVKPDFRLTPENAAAVARITRQLDGLPLAIELAAARSKHLSPASIGDRLTGASDVLADGPIDRPPHQRAMRDTIAWSVNLLDAGEKVLFHRLSIFAGGFQPQAVAYICGASKGPPVILAPEADPRGIDQALASCISLADKNLIFNSGELAYEPRFSMLLTIRSFAHTELHRLGEWDALGYRHATWCLAFAMTAAVAIRGSSQSAWLDWLEAELPNLRVGLDWFREHGELQAFAAMANALSLFWLVRGHLAEGLRWLQMVIEAEGSVAIEHPIRTDLHCAAGWLALRQGNPGIARAYAEESLAGARANARPAQVGAALRLLGDIEDRLTNYARAGELLHDALAAYQEAGNQTGIAGIALDTEDYEHAERLFREAIVAATAAHDASMLARVIDALSVTLHVKGASAKALECAEQALELFRAQGDVRGIAVATDHVGKCSRSLGDVNRAWSSHRDSLAWRRKHGDPRGMMVWLEAMAGLLESCDAFESAACVLGATDNLRKRGGFPMHNHERAQLQPTMLRTSDHLSSSQFARSWDRGSQMTLSEIVDLAYQEADRAVIAKSEDKDQAPARMTAAALADSGLSAREWEVAQLLALRLSNKEIANRLAISPRTVSTHVSSILSKLGVHSRRDAAKIVSKAAPDPPG